MKTKQKFMLQVDGWRGISHSYALVNQFQLLQWNRSDDVLVKHRDVPFFMAHWSASTNSAGFNSQDINIIEANHEIEPQAIYKIFAPFELKADSNLPTLTFGVTEFGFSNDAFTQEDAVVYRNAGGKIHTPSTWSKNRLAANGIDESIVHVIPHAADSNYFYPLPQTSIEEQRKVLGYNQDDVVLLNVGSHLWNKGLDVLIKAFAVARRTNKNLKLLLKDQRSTYLMSSDNFVNNILAEVNDLEALRNGSIKILTDHLNLSQLNSAYNVSDYYLTPYRAEGFNLPALEAASAGTSVIATKGGATDDFLLDPCHIKLSGHFIENAKLKDDLPVNAYIEPNIAHLIEILKNCHRKTGPVLPGHLPSWMEVTEKLVDVMKQRG
jgi:glycosyltransferase involved in cell wall biosynthesis